MSFLEIVEAVAGTALAAAGLWIFFFFLFSL
jgi:hypothetical protein